MKLFRTLVIAATVWTATVAGTGRASSQGAAPPPNIGGKWLGTITFGSTNLRIGFDVSGAPGGGYTGSMRSIDQAGLDLPMSAVLLNGDSVRLEMDAIGSVYQGKFTADGSMIEGNWLQRGTTTPLVMKRVDEYPQIIRPQTPKRPYPYREEDVGYENRSASVHIAGTLTLPEGEGPFPAVLLMVGSGPLDRDETVFYHKPFLVLADHLTRKGIAVLRVDKRGVGKSTGEKLTGDYSETTVQDLAADALAGVDYLKGRKEIDAKHLGLLGHSEGGVVGPIAASQSSDVAFLVMLAGLGQNNGEIIIFQKTLAAREQGADENTLALIRSWYERVYALARENTASAAAEQKIRALHATLTPEEKAKVGWPDNELDHQIKAQLRRHWRADLQYDPGVILQKVHCPVLALGGGNDLQVPAKENLAGIEQALKAGGNTRFTIREFPAMNHGLQTVPPGTKPGHIQTQETMSPTVLETISDWILMQTKHPPR